MISSLARIDWHASASHSPWHRASALGKLLLAALLVLLAIFAPSLSLLVTVHLIAWALALSSRLPFRMVLGAAAYPLFFSLLFAIVTWDGAWGPALRLVLRPLAASLVAVWLVGTTPYPDLFAPISRLLPRGAADGLFLTYRALFELIGRAERLLRALKLRGSEGLPPKARIGVAGEALGGLVLHGFHRSQRLYAAMALRGHTGRICGCRHYAELSNADGWVAAIGVVVLVAAVLLWRTP